MLTHLVALCAVTSLAACVLAAAGGGAGVAAGGGAPAACALQLSDSGDGFALAGEVAGAGPADWALRAEAHDGSVRVLQSGPVMPGGEAGRATLPGDPGDYDLALTVTRAGQDRTCPLTYR